MTAALAAEARDVGVDAQYRAVLVLDGAGWHASARLAVPEGIDLVALPPYSTELQPAERLWNLVDEPVANRTFADLDELEAVLVRRCQVLAAERRTIKAHTRYHWWPRERHPHRFAP